MLKFSFQTKISHKYSSVKAIPIRIKTQKRARRPLADISIRYTYEVTPGLGDAIIPTTRDFCRRLIELDRVYSRAEIQQISQRLGYSVWQRRGGFYHNPRTGVTTPYCRHRWVEQVVIK